VSRHHDLGFLDLAARLSAHTGLDLQAYKSRCLRRRILVRMRACGVHSYADYLRTLESRDEERQRLLDALTINVTRFFRNPETWAYLGAQLLPPLLEERAGDLRVWSAGCASGEEAYTLVMLVARVLDRLGRLGWLSRLRVDATDIDRESLLRAEAAIYPEGAFSEAEPGVRQQFAVPTPDGQWQLAPEVRGPVWVGRQDLLQDPPLSRQYDLICCRNVVIYFDRPSQERLLERFADALAPRGLLVLGKVETILGDVRRRYELIEPRERVYRRAA
jgi:chemotaxis methyl-accepting protein methylase